ncbi:MAG: isoprenylcysteine carboxylmethyltransferase family protein [Anaerolineae bacterium]|jgi:protein-S-isoprenylcysteine O-methyltransferase Ste14|nr:isoprenylcysteine carboxylmethyltransferase family protein [Anaerolineae bacterium]
MTGNIFGVFIFTILTVLRIQQLLNGSWIAVFLFLQSAIAVVLYFRRANSAKNTAQKKQVLAWLSALFPLAFSPRASAEMWHAFLLVPGLILTLWAMLSLNRSFSVAPADRGLVWTGAYRFIRHPMYAGEILSFIGILIGSFSAWNTGVFILFVISVIWRIYTEEALIENYKTYKEEVRWRVLWKVF